MATARKFRLGSTNPFGVSKAILEAVNDVTLQTSQRKDELTSDLALTGGANKRHHWDPKAVAKGRWIREITKFGLIGQNLIELIVELYGRKVNANETMGPGKGVLEAAERYIWLFTEKKPVHFPKAIEMHRSGDIYWHKLPLGFFLPYCNGNPVRRFLERGFDTLSIFIKPPKHFHSAVLGTASFLITMQHNWTGAQGMDNALLFWAPYFEADFGSLTSEEARRLVEWQARQMLQSFQYEVNQVYRPGAQSSFTNFAFVWLEGTYLLDEVEPILPGGRKGKPGDYWKYLDTAIFLWKKHLQVLNEGDGRGLPYTYPVLTLYWGPKNKKLLEDDPELFELFWKEQARFGNFYFLNTRVIDPNSVLAMCCRYLSDKKGMEVDEAEDVNRGGVFSLPEATGSLTIASVNVPRIALMSEGDWEKFFELLKERTRTLGKMLAAHHKIIEALYDAPIYHYIRQVLTRQEFAHYFATIGVIGLPEAVLIMKHFEDGTTYEAWGIGGEEGDAGFIRWAATKGAEIVSTIVEISRELKEEYGVPFNVEQVPGETAASRLFELDWQVKEWRPILKAVLPPDPDNPDEPLPTYSNFNTPSWSTAPLWTLVDAEATIQPKYTGGVMRHFFIGQEFDIEAVAKLNWQIREYGDGETKAMVYWSWSVGSWSCPNGHRGVGMPSKCPICGAPVKRKIRIVGWPTDDANWSPGRDKEKRMRGFLHASGLGLQNYPFK